MQFSRVIVIDSIVRVAEMLIIPFNHGKLHWSDWLIDLALKFDSISLMTSIDYFHDNCLLLFGLSIEF